MDDLFTIAQAAKSLNCSVRWIQQLIKDRRLLAEGEGRTRWITRKSLDAYRSGVPVWMLEAEREGGAKEGEQAVSEFESEPLLADLVNRIVDAAAKVDYGNLPDTHKVEIEDGGAILLLALRKARDWQKKQEKWRT